MKTAKERPTGGLVSYTLLLAIKTKFIRSTAKKFLAAANFLELLKVFERSNNAQVVCYSDIFSFYH